MLPSCHGAATTGAGTSLTGVPDLDYFVSHWVQKSGTMEDLYQLPVPERTRMVRSAQRLQQRQELRAGVEAYLAGCIRRYHDQRAPYARVEAPATPLHTENQLNSPVRSSFVNVSPISEARSVIASPCAARPMEPPAEEIGSPMVVPVAPPQWHGNAMALREDIGSLCRCIGEQVGSAANAALATLPPKVQYGLCIAALVSENAVRDLDAFLLAGVRVLQMGFAPNRPPSADLSPPPQAKRDVVVLALGFGFGAIPVAMRCVTRAMTRKYPEWPLIVSEMHLAPPDSLSQELDARMQDLAPWPLYVHQVGADMKKAAHDRESDWASSPRSFVILACINDEEPDLEGIGLDLQTTLSSRASMHDIAVMMFHRGTSAAVADACEKALGEGMQVSAEVFGSSTRPWIMHRSHGSGPLQHLAPPSPVELPLGVRLMPLEARSTEPGAHYLPSPQDMKRISDDLVFEPTGVWSHADTVIRNAMSQQVGDGPVTLLSRGTILAQHGWARMPQEGKLEEIRVCYGSINVATGAPMSATTPGAEACGRRKYCRYCEEVYAVTEATVHGRLLVDSVLTLLCDAWGPRAVGRTGMGGGVGAAA